MKPNTAPHGTFVQRFLARLLGPSSAAELARGAAGTFAVNIVGVGLLYLIHVLLARVMGVDHYGVFAYVITWAGILLLFGRIGLDTSIVRYVAAYDAKREWSSMRGILRRSDQLGLLASAAVGATTAAVVWTVRARLGPELTRTFLVASAMLPVMSLNTLRAAALRALGHPVLSRAIGSILRPLILAVLVGVLLLRHAGRIDGPVAMAINGLAFAGCFLAGSYYLRRSLPGAVMESEAVFRDRKWLAMALPAFLVSGMSLVLQSTDKIMIGAMMGTSQAGIYAAASRSAGLMAFGLQAVNAVLAPMISKLHASGRKDGLQRLLTLAARGIFAFTLPVGVVLLVWGRLVLGFFGAEFVEGYPALAILIVAQMVSALSGSVGALLMMTGHQRPVSAILAFSALLNVALNVMLIPRYGLVGAAVATGAATVLWNVLMLAAAFRRLGLNPTVLASGRARRE